jgi:phosphoglycerol geranylgeranyltransferase
MTVNNKRLIFHIDVNSAYLSWEAVYRLQQGAEIDLRTIPSVVGGDVESRHGIVLTKSIPAKKYGIQTGETLFTARQKCPDLVVVPPHYELYMLCSNAMVNILKEYTPTIQRYSVDECFLDFTSMENFYEDPVELAYTIKDRIRNELGFTASVGISNNKLLAKMGSDIKKPDAVITLFPIEIKDKMWPLPVEDLFMVGRATLTKLHNLNIFTIGDLANFDLKILKEKLKKGPLHMTLIDPDKQEPARAGEIAKVAADLGTDAIMVGGSTGVTQENLDKTVKAIKAAVKVPVIYFPSGANAISPYSDAMYFMSMLNSRNIKMVIGEQVAGAPIVKKLGLEPLSMGYIIVAPGMKVGEVGQAEVVPRDKPKTAVAYALAAQYLGMSYVYLEAGSGAPQAVPEEMIAAVRKAIDIPLLVGGGIRDAETATKVKNAGANVVITGTVVEHGEYVARLESIIRAIKA